MTDSTILKSKIFKEDMALALGGTGAAETGSRLTSAGGVLTLTKLDKSHFGSPKGIPVSTYAELLAAKTAIGSNTGYIQVMDDLTVSADLSLGTNICLLVDYGAVITVATTKTLTLNGGLIAGPYQIFSCSGTGAVVFGSSHVPEVRPEWWGADPSGISDSTDEIQLAINSLPTTTGGVIQFSVGKYLVTPNSLSITTSGTILRGRGATTNGTGDIFGSSLKSAAGTGEMVSYVGASATVTVDSCQINDITLDGQEETVIGLSLKWVSNFRSTNLWISECYDDGVYMEQVWDSSFYDLEIEGCGAQATGKVGLHIYNGTTDNSNNLRFFSFHAESNYGDDVWIDATAAGTGGNYNILFQGGKCEKSQAVGSYSTKAFKISGWTGATGKPNQAITIRDMCISQYMVAGDIGIHFAGDGHMTVDNCLFINNVDGGTGITIAGPVVGPYTHKLTNNSFTNVAQEITITTATCPRNRVWTDGNTNALWSESDSRIHINTPLVLDRRPMILASDGTTKSTSGTGEDTLNSCTLLANLLGTYGGLRVKATGWFEGSADTRVVKFYFGSNSYTVGTVAGGTAGDWELDIGIRIIDGVSTDIHTAWRWTLNGSPATINSDHNDFAEATDVDVTIKLTGTCTNGADTIHQLSWLVVEE